MEFHFISSDPGKVTMSFTEGAQGGPMTGGEGGLSWISAYSEISISNTPGGVQREALVFIMLPSWERRPCIVK